jgi:hypothetical protein
MGHGDSSELMNGQLLAAKEHFGICIGTIFRREVYPFQHPFYVFQVLLLAGHLSALDLFLKLLAFSV